MKKYCRLGWVILLFGSVLFGVIYPLAIWCVAHIFFPHSAEGSPIVVEKTLCGFKTIGQHFSSPKYFSSRPEVGLLEVSGGSNLSWTSKLLLKKVAERIIILRRQDMPVADLPPDLLMQSASGFDPHISFRAALFQVGRIAYARNIHEKELLDMLLEKRDCRLFGLFPDRVNVLLLNKELDCRFPI